MKRQHRSALLTTSCRSAGIQVDIGSRVRRGQRRGGRP